MADLDTISSAEFQTDGHGASGAERPKCLAVGGRALPCAQRWLLLSSHRTYSASCGGLADSFDRALQRYCCGDSPVQRLNACRKFAVSLYPRISAIASVLRHVWVKYRTAKSRRVSATIS